MTDAAIQLPPVRARARKLPFAALLIIAGLCVALVTHSVNDSDGQSFDPLDAKLALAYGPANFDEAIAEADKLVQLNNERVSHDDGQWSYHEARALAFLSRAQLTASFDDYLGASRSIDKATALAPEGAGPGLAIAVVNLGLHRNRKAFEGVELAAAAVVTPDIKDLAEIEAIRGDLALYQGEYLKAFQHFENAAEQHQEAATLFRLANWYKYRGEFDQAIAQYKEGAKIGKSRTPHRLAVYLLQIGALEMQQGHWDTARRYFERADRVFPGYWLAQAHVAQMDAAQGKLAAAEKVYLGIIRTTDNPDVMAALISLYEQQGRDREAAVWAKRAGSIWEKRMSLLPETYYDHAFDHAMGVGDIQSALALARKNFTARPYGDAAIGYALALVANDESRRALTILETQEKSGWRSVELYAALSDTHTSLGNSSQSDWAKNRALAINSKAFEPAAELLSFGNH